MLIERHQERGRVRNFLWREQEQVAARTFSEAEVGRVEARAAWPPGTTGGRLLLPVLGRTGLERGCESRGQGKGGCRSKPVQALVILSDPVPSLTGRLKLA